MNKPTPTRGGAWRVIDGALVDEGAQPAAAPIEQVPAGDPVPVETEVRTAEPGEPLPPIQDPKPRPSRRNAPSNAQ